MYKPEIVLRFESKLGYEIKQHENDINIWGISGVWTTLREIESAISGNWLDGLVKDFKDMVKENKSRYEKNLKRGNKNAR